MLVHDEEEQGFAAGAHRIAAGRASYASSTLARTPAGALRDGGILERVGEEPLQEPWREEAWEEEYEAAENCKVRDGERAGDVDLSRSLVASEVVVAPVSLRFASSEAEEARRRSPM